MLPYKPLDTFVHAVSKFLAEYHRPPPTDQFQRPTAQNVALDAR
jgi:hypothetical protein